MLVLIVSFLLIFFLEAARRQRNETLVLKYKYRFFALRDDLREYAMENPGVTQNWVFQYLDSTTAKVIRLLPRMSCWYLIGLWLTHRNDPNLRKARGLLEQAYSEPENQKHKEIQERMIKTLAEFMVSRHILLLIVSTLALILPAAITRGMREVKRLSLELIVESPETSTLYKFAQAAS